LAGIVNPEALSVVDRDHGGALGATPDVPSGELVAAGGHPRIAENVANLSVAEAAKLDRTAFVKTATKGVKAAERPAAEAAAAATWADARRVVAIVDAWKEAPG
jgi:hypothetical protein